MQIHQIGICNLIFSFPLLIRSIPHILCNTLHFVLASFFNPWCYVAFPPMSVYRNLPLYLLTSAQHPIVYLIPYWCAFKLSQCFAIINTAEMNNPAHLSFCRSWVCILDKIGVLGQRINVSIKHLGYSHILSKRVFSFSLPSAMYKSACFLSALSMCSWIEFFASWRNNITLQC